MIKKRGPVSYSTYQEAKDRIKELESHIITDNSAVIATLQARIALLEAELDGIYELNKSLMGTIGRRDQRIALLVAEVDRLQEARSVLFDGYSVLKEMERLNPGMKFNAAFTAHISRMLDAVVSLQRQALLQEDKPNE